MQLSARVQRIKPSPTLAVTARAAELKAQGKDIIGLGAGEPDFDTPEHIKEAAHKAIRDGFTKYTPVGGTPGLKKAIIAKLERDNGLKYGPKQILVSCGGKQSCYNLCQALLNSGDEVVIPAPYWVSYPDMVLLSDGKPVFIETTPEARYKITAEQLAAAITPRTRLIFLNSPSNPSGIAYSKAELTKLGEVLRKHPQVVIATDDMYEKIMWTAEPFANILNAGPDLYERTVVIHAVSKTYSMTGWRIGFAAGPEPLIKAMENVQSQSTSNPTSISQVAAEAALNGDQTCVTRMVEAFKQRHDYVYAQLAKMPGVKVLPSDGTFYSFPDFLGAIKHLGLKSDLEFGDYLIEKGVAMVPGSAFGTPGAMRISFATSQANLEKALARTAEAIK
ncbi:MAG: pyridoxal phosphate-dependent aminotransferase [Burkholderiales bacterium]